MWAGGTDARYVDAISRPYRLWTRVDVETHAGVALETDVPIVDGSVTANLQNRVTRRLSFTLKGMDWFPADQSGDVDPGAVLAPYGNRVRAWAGVEYGDGSIVRFPVFYGRIDQVSAPGGLSTVVECVDLAGDVADAAFEVPTSSIAANTVYAEWQRLILAAVDNAQFEAFPGGQAAAPIGPLTWEQDRGQALDNMAAGVGSLWWTLADGTFVLRPQPWSTPGKAVDLVLADSARAGARRMSTGFEPALARTGVNNSVVFAAERLDGSPPLYSIARDLDSTSATYYLGPFGKKPLLIKNQSPTTQQQVDYAARVQLHYARSLSYTWRQVQIPTDASIELGDLAQVRAAGLVSPQTVVGFTLPFREGAMMSLDLRAYVPIGEG